jgi:hypothetical protein
MRKKIIIFTFLSIFYSLSCKKELEGTLNEDITVTIDSFKVSGFDNIFVKASFQNIPVSGIKGWGFCWSEDPDPTTLDSIRVLSLTQPFEATINNIGKRAKFYFRAYITTAKRTIYSNDVNINTHGLQVKWEKGYNNGKTKVLVQVIETTDNSFLELNQTYGNSIAWTEIIKVDSSGNIKWDHEYNQNEWKEPNFIMNVPDGYIFTTTKWQSYSMGVFVTKIDLNGAKIWEKGYNRKIMQEFVRLDPLSDNKFFLTTMAFDGFDNNAIRTNCSINDFEINANGDLISENSVLNNHKLYESSFHFSVLSIPDDGFIILGDHLSIKLGTSTFDILVQKYNRSDQLSWEKTYGGNQDDFSVKIAPSPSGNYVILGNSYSKGTTGQSDWLFEIDKNNGNMIRDISYGVLHNGSSGCTHPIGFFIHNRKYFISGALDCNQQESAYIVKTDENGDLLWEYTYKEEYGYNYSLGNNIVVNSNDEIYVFGTGYGQPDNSNSLFITKFKEY